MPPRQAACAHCPAGEPAAMPPCCGVCVFSRRRCSDFFPGEARSQAVARHLAASGFPLASFTPCELFARIRGRTLWVVGDSQAWNLYYAAECFLREFSRNLRRTRAAPFPDDHLLTTVHAPVPYPPLCLDLALGTRVCAVRVDGIREFIQKVAPTLQSVAPGFSNDIMVLNFGLHYPTPGADGRPVGASLLARATARLATWRQQHRAVLPAIVWMDTPVQHFATPDGTWPGGDKPFTCVPLTAWYRGVPAVVAGGPFNTAVAPSLPRLANAHLKTYNASVPLVRTHWPDECSHWCHPSAYQLWLLLLNGVLRDKQLGSAAHMRDGCGTAAKGPAGAEPG